MDVIFISYSGNPNCEENYKDLLTKFSHAKRVHGVKGIYEAYYEASKLNESEFYMAIDGDTIVWNSIKDIHPEDIKDNQIYYYPTVNNVLGISGGTGSIKYWSKNIFNYVTKEEFNLHSDWVYCNSIEIIYHDNTTVGETIINTTPLQAFTTGFRETFKTFKTKPNSMEYILKWCDNHDSINGDWVTLGARLGLKYAIEYPTKIKELYDYDLANIINDVNLEDAQIPLEIFIKPYYKQLFRNAYKLTKHPI